MLVYCHKITPRVRYIMKLMLGQILGFEFLITNSEEEFKKEAGPKLAYSGKTELGGLSIVPHGLLFEDEISGISPDFAMRDGKPRLCLVVGGAMDMDPFAAAFYLVSRYEEYLPFKPDEHGRFTASQSMAYNNGFLTEPVVDQWAYDLLELIQANYPNCKIVKREYNYISTIDVDNAFAYKAKGSLRTAGGFAKDAVGLRLSNSMKRIKSVSGAKDPFDTYDYQLELKQKYRFESIYFWLFAEFGQHDKSASPGNQKFRELIRSVSDNARCAIHPSYASHESVKVLEKEVNGLSEVVHRTIDTSRQHYLKMSLPLTYSKLLSVGIRHDHSMGYATDFGFRAGTCTPHYFYNLEDEAETQLMIHPFSVMDVTGYDYHKKTTDEVIEMITDIITKVKLVKGTFISVWHNRTFSELEPEWKGWNSVYEKMVETAMG